MNASTRFLIPALAIGAIVLPACGGFEIVLGEEGSGVPETTTYEFDSFDGVQIGSAFEATIELADGPPTVEITVDDNFTDDLDVEVEDGNLHVSLDIRNFRADVTPTAVITMPSLDLIDGSGATDITVEGVADAADLTLRASGASEVWVDVDTEILTVDASGASEINVSGTADRVELDASGASIINLDDVVADTGVVEASGASTVSIGEATDIDGDLSGASNLRLPREAADDIDTSGASSIDRR